MEKREKRSYIPYIIIGLICLLVVAYTIYHVTSIFAKDMSTITAGVMTETKSISGSGYVFRDETLLYSSNSGVVDYLVSDGEKVRSGQAVADVYSDTPSLSSREVIGLIDRQIAILEESVASPGADMTKIRQAANDCYYSIAKRLSDGDIRGISEETKALLSNLNMIRSLIDEENATVSETLKTLVEMREEMISVAGDCIRECVSESGYFYFGVDGYEDVFTKSFAENADGDTLYSLISGEAAPTDASDTCYGKIAESSEWLFAMTLERDKAEVLEIGGEYLVNLLSEGESSMLMTLEKMLDVSLDKENVILVFSCNRLMESGALDRRMNVSIALESISGIYVPKDAVAFVDGQRGVYILKGSVVRFRAIDVLYERKEYYLVDGDFDDSESEFAYLSTNELIIINGQNLFDGRILD